MTSAQFFFELCSLSDYTYSIANYMKKRKIISAVIVLSGFVLFAMIVSMPDKKDREAADKNGVSGTGDVSGLGFQVNQNRNLVTNPTNAGGSAPTTDNLTDSLARGLSQNILQMNEGFDSGQGTSTIKIPSSDSFSEMIDQSIGEQNLRIPVFSQKDIRIGSDNSTNAQIAYMESLNDITKKNFAGFNTPILTVLNNFFERIDSDALAKYVSIAESEVGDLLALKVPQQLSAWHLQNLNLWGKKLVVYKAILDLNTDPLKASLAIQEIGGIGQENDNLQNLINEFAKKLPGNS